jgi:hypothetical protein
MTAKTAHRRSCRAALKLNPDDPGLQPISASRTSSLGSRR